MTLRSTLKSRKKESRKKPCKKNTKVANSSLRPKPKRPNSAYNYFFRDQRATIMLTAGVDGTQVSNSPATEENPDGKVSFEQLGKIVGRRWRNIDEKTLKRYKQMAENDSQRYKKEMSDYYEEENARRRAKYFSELGVHHDVQDGTSKKGFREGCSQMVSPFQYKLKSQLHCEDINFHSKANLDTNTSNIGAPWKTAITNTPPSFIHSHGRAFHTSFGQGKDLRTSDTFNELAHSWHGHEFQGSLIDGKDSKRPEEMVTESLKDLANQARVIPQDVITVTGSSGREGPSVNMENRLIQGATQEINNASNILPHAGSSSFHLSLSDRDALSQLGSQINDFPLYNVPFTGIPSPALHTAQGYATGNETILLKTGYVRTLNPPYAVARSTYLGSNAMGLMPSSLHFKQYLQPLNYGTSLGTRGQMSVREADHYYPEPEPVSKATFENVNNTAMCNDGIAIETETKEGIKPENVTSSKEPYIETVGSGAGHLSS